MITDFLALYGQDLARLILGSLTGSAITLWWSRRSKQESESEKIALAYIDAVKKSKLDCRNPWFRLWLFQRCGALDLENGRSRELVLSRIKNRGFPVPGDEILMAKTFGVFTLMNLAIEAGADLKDAGDVYLKIMSLLKKHKPPELI